LTYEAERIPDEIHLYAVSLSDPSGVTPERHVHIVEQLSWFEVADALPRYAISSRGGAQPIRCGQRTE
jgi:hypothetical protein